MCTKFNPGDPVFVVLRDDCAEPVSTCGYIFLMEVKDVVFAAPGINGARDIDSVLCYLMNCTEDDEELPLVAVPEDDCYHTLAEAKEAMQNELDD